MLLDAATAVALASEGLVGTLVHCACARSNVVPDALPFIDAAASDLISSLSHFYSVGSYDQKH